MLLANADTLAFSAFGDNVVEHVSAAGVADRPSGTEALELEPGERDASVGADVPIGGRGAFLLKTDGGLTDAAVLVRRCDFCRPALRDDGGRLD